MQPTSSMKYIRTKDNKILEVGEDSAFEFNDNIYGYLYKGEFIGNSVILKTADTIEELCDEAVFFSKDNKPHYKSQEGNLWYLGASLFTESLRFGIFTDKGLIYVAKMNDKGELELL